MFDQTCLYSFSEVSEPGYRRAATTGEDRGISNKMSDVNIFVVMAGELESVQYKCNVNPAGIAKLFCFMPPLVASSVFMSSFACLSDRDQFGGVEGSAYTVCRK